MATDKAQDVTLSTPTILPDGTQVLSGPVPGNQVAGMTQVTPKVVSNDNATFAAVPGGVFTICGDFGPLGMVHVGPTQVTVTSWQSYRIKGLLPPGLDVKQEVKVTDAKGVVTKIPYKVPPPLQSYNAPIMVMAAK